MEEKIKQSLLFNPDGKDEIHLRSIIKGETTGLFNLNSTKYSWAKSLYQVMIGNFWVPEKISGLKDDARMSVGYMNINEGYMRNIIIDEYDDNYYLKKTEQQNKP